MRICERSIFGRLLRYHTLIISYLKKFKFNYLSTIYSYFSNCTFCKRNQKEILKQFLPTFFPIFNLTTASSSIKSRICPMEISSDFSDTIRPFFSTKMRAPKLIFDKSFFLNLTREKRFFLLT